MGHIKTACSFMMCMTIILTAGEAALAAPAASTVPAFGLVPPRMQAPIGDGILKCLQLLTFYVHIILVNIVLGSVLLAIIDPKNAQAGSKTGVSFMPKILALAVNFGIAPFLFMQVVYGSFLYPSVVLMAVWWVSIIFAVMLAYYGLYVSDGAVLPERRGPVLMLTALMLLLTAFLLVNMNTLAQRPESWLAWFTHPNGTVLNFGDRTLFPRFTHILVASVAVGGLTMAWRSRWSKGRPGDDPAAAARGERRGLDWFFYASLAQIGAGLLFLLSLPAPIRALYLGGSALHTAPLVLALTGLCFALYFARRGALERTTATLAGIILLMVSIRALLRDAMLRPYIEAASRDVTPLAMPEGQHAAFILFLASLVIGAISFVWLGRVLHGVYGRGGVTGKREA